MTTLSRELKTIFNNVLLKDGIYPDDDEGSNRAREGLAEKLVSAARMIRTFADDLPLRKVSAPVLERNKMLLLFSERINAELDTHINFQKNLRGSEVTIHATWAKVIDFMIEREAEGETIEKYAEWYKNPDNRFKAPASFKIGRDPMLIKYSWADAFPKLVEAQSEKFFFEEEETVTETPEEEKNKREALLAKIAEMERIARERKRLREAQS